MVTAGPNPVELLRRLLRFDTSNPPGNEGPCLEFIAELLRSAGLEPAFYARGAQRPNLLARLRGRGASPPLLLYGHVDVVPARASEWVYPPFGADLVDGEVWGRGALDMKGGVAMFLAALLRAAEERFEPAGDVILALLSDEEAGSSFGAAYVVAEHPGLFEGVRYALSEVGAFTQWTAGRPLYPIQVAEKRRCVIQATIRGRGGHGATVVRGTAAEAAGRFLMRLTKSTLPAHVTPLARLMIDSMAPALPSHQRLALRSILRASLTDRILKVFGEDGDTLRPLFHNTATPTVLAGGESTNVVPTELTVTLDGRVLPGYTPYDLVQELRQLLGDVAHFEIVREEPSPRSDPDLTLFPLLAEVLTEGDPRGTPIPMLLPGYTDARYFDRLGIQTYGFLPMRLPRHVTTELIHAPNERVPAEAVQFGADRIYEVLRRYAL